MRDSARMRLMRPAALRACAANSSGGASYRVLVELYDRDLRLAHPQRILSESGRAWA